MVETPSNYSTAPRTRVFFGVKQRRLLPEKLIGFYIINKDLVEATIAVTKDAKSISTLGWTFITTSAETQKRPQATSFSRIPPSNQENRGLGTRI